MKIVICGSVLRSDEEMNKLAYKLRANGNSVVCPADVPYHHTQKAEEKIENKLFYHKAIEESDIIFVYNEKGIGISTAMEIQYALCLKKPVRLLFEPDEIELKALCCSTKFNVAVDKYTIGEC